jgi:DNA repair protein RadD
MQEVAFHDLVLKAPDAVLLQLVPTSARSLLSQLKAEVLEGESLQRLVRTSASIRDYLLNEECRPVILAMLGRTSARNLTARLGLPAEADPHRTLSDASGHLSPQQVEELLEFFGAGAPPQGGGNGGSTVKQTSASYPLFSHQRNALRRVQESLYAGSRRVVLHMPTGAGKTRTAMNIVCEHLRNHEPTVVVWLASSEELLEQAASEFEVAWGCLGNRPLDVIRFWGGRSADLTEVSDGLVVAGLAKLHATTRRNGNLIPSLGDETSLVVMDEAHQSIAETYQQVLETLGTKRPNTSMLGLTATPGRTYSDVGQDAQLARFWTGRKVMLEVPGYDNPVKYLIEERYLARPLFRTVHSTPGIAPDSQDLEQLQESLDLPDELLARLGDSDIWNMTIIQTTQDLLARHRRVIVFATSVGQAVTLSAVMRALGHQAWTVTGMTPKAERASILQQYTSNASTPMAVFNYGVLTTGFDAPATSAAVIARPTRSLVLYSQMVGRALRGTRAGGNATAEIVTVIDPELPGFGDPAEAFTNWEDVW